MTLGLFATRHSSVKHGKSPKVYPENGGFDFIAIFPPDRLTLIMTQNWNASSGCPPVPQQVVNWCELTNYLGIDTWRPWLFRVCVDPVASMANTADQLFQRGRRSKVYYLWHVVETPNVKFAVSDVPWHLKIMRGHCRSTPWDFRAELSFQCSSKLLH